MRIPAARNFYWLATLCLLTLPITATAQEVGPAQGHLIAVGGAMRDPAIFQKFLELAGGPDSPIVIIPTAGGAEDYGDDWKGLERYRKMGATNLTLLHTYDRAVADTEEFVRPLREARGVFISGGRQWRLADSYLHTRTHKELQAVLDRGGVIGGSSAGATILGSFLVRGDTKTNTIMDGDHKEGFGFLRRAGIDQHVLKRNRQFDLIRVIEDHPELLGIGIDEDTAIVVSGDEFTVIGQSYVVILDQQKSIPPGGQFYLLAAGDRYNLKTRQATRPDEEKGLQPLERVTEEAWQ